MADPSLVDHLNFVFGITALGVAAVVVVEGIENYYQNRRNDTYEPKYQQPPTREDKL